MGFAYAVTGEASPVTPSRFRSDWGSSLGAARFIFLRNHPSACREIASVPAVAAAGVAGAATTGPAPGASAHSHDEGGRWATFQRGVPAASLASAPSRCQRRFQRQASPNVGERLLGPSQPRPSSRAWLGASAGQAGAGAARRGRSPSLTRRRRPLGRAHFGEGSGCSWRTVQLRCSRWGPGPASLGLDVPGPVSPRVRLAHVTWHT